MLVKDLIEYLEKHDQYSRIVLVDVNQRILEIDLINLMFVHQLNAVVVFTNVK